MCNAANAADVPRQENQEQNRTKSNWGDRMKRIIVSLVAAAALAAPVGWASTAGAKSGPDPDANGDVLSHCHTGSKFIGACGEDAGPGTPKDTSDDAACAAAPVTPVNPGTPGASPGTPA